jgi:hypothetical protein
MTAILCGLLFLAIWGLALVAMYNLGVQDGRQRERVATARAMETIRKHYAVPVKATYPTPGDVGVCDCDSRVGEGCRDCCPDGMWRGHLSNRDGTKTTTKQWVSAEQWCKRNGTTMEAMAEAQEDHEAEGDHPIGRCVHCGTPVYTVPGYCGRCKVLGS